MSIREDLDDVAFQLAIWGYAFTGEVIEPGALTAEFRPAKQRYVAEANRLFDRAARSLDGCLLDRGDGYRRPPDHWALPWVTEHLMRQGLARCDWLNEQDPQ